MRQVPLTFDELIFDNILSLEIVAEWIAASDWTKVTEAFSVHQVRPCLDLYLYMEDLLLYNVDDYALVSLLTTLWDKNCLNDFYAS